MKVSGKVRVVNEGNSSITNVIGEDGHPIHGITRIKIEQEAGSPPVAEIGLFGLECDIYGKAVYIMMDPAEGRMKQVKSVTFTDGKTLEFGEDDVSP